MRFAGAVTRAAKLCVSAGVFAVLCLIKRQKPRCAGFLR